MIRFVDFSREYKNLRKEIEQAINRVGERGWFVLGPEVENFEKSLAKYLGVKYCVGVNSGTDALYLSLLAAGVSAGDEVIVPANTAIPTAMAVLMSGANPVFVDCDDAYLIDIDKITKAITAKTKAIIPVHLYGQACDMEKLSALAKEHKLVLIEDCAQALGATWQGRQVGSWGDFGCFSFYPTKNLGAYGDGGAIAVNNEAAYKKLLTLRFYGQKDRYNAESFGINSRLDELQAAILSVKLKYLDEWNGRRQAIAELYCRSISNPAITLPTSKNKENHVWHLFVVRTSQRDKLQQALKEAGIETLIHYPKALTQQAVFKEYVGEPCPKAEQYANEVLSLPLHPFLADEEANQIVAAINRS